MCGIAGIINLRNQPVADNSIRQMTTALSHRGPDADGYYSHHQIALGHRRLSILDLSTGANQPFTDNSGRYVMVFNGEMYNFHEVKALLPHYEFKTTGDTEVLIAAFAQWGPDCIRHFKGMFAFAIWDTEKQELILMRDRMGVKPVYYYHDKENFLFASEIRAILATGLVKRKLSMEGLYEFLSYQSIGYPLTAVQDVYQLEAGSYLTISHSGVTKTQYWDITDRPVDFDFGDPAGVRKKSHGLLAASVERRLVSDVPVGAFLSGGIDSSVVVGLMAEVSTARPNTFTISFQEKEFDESPFADLVAAKFNTIHTNIRLEPTVLLEELENALNALDSPSGDGINSYVVSKAIRQAGITVALSGIGGDELFAGYPLFLQFLRLQKKAGLYRHTKLLRQMAAGILSVNASNRSYRLQQIIGAPEPSIGNVYPVSRQILSPGLIRELTFLGSKTAEDTVLWQQLDAQKENIGKHALLSQVSIADYLGYTQHTLLKDTDQMSMASSLEVREPFFDQDLVEFVLCIPDKLKFPTYPKSLLVESVHPLLPPEVVHRPKQGFLLPWNLWMKNELKSFCEAKITRLSRRPFIRSENLILYWKKFLQNDTSIRWTELWLFVVLEHWLEKNGIEE